jgi:6-pyruvoyltetrahydropterin/6-carboxytetrahydropterin synthase
VSVTRRYRFAAAHVLRSRVLSDAENERIYGNCANPNGHGHNYGLEVTLRGPVDAESGSVVSIAWLDNAVRERILDRLGHRLLNDDPWFADRVPTAENIATFARDEIAAALGGDNPVVLERVRLHETRRNVFECGA